MLGQHKYCRTNSSNDKILQNLILQNLFSQNLIQFVPKSVDLNTVELFSADINSVDTIICRPYYELILDLNMQKQMG